MKTFTFQLSSGLMFDVSGDNAKQGWTAAIERLDAAGELDRVQELTLANVADSVTEAPSAKELADALAMIMRGPGPTMRQSAWRWKCDDIRNGLLKRARDAGLTK